MRKTLLRGFVLLVFATGAWAADAEVEQGKYLAENLGGCVDCHTPMLPNGQMDKAHSLKGAMLTFQAIQKVPGWMPMSPDITSGGDLWKKWGEAGFVKFLESAQWPNGDKAGPPMPSFHLKTRDAKAIVAYLKTLK